MHMHYTYHMAYNGGMGKNRDAAQGSVELEVMLLGRHAVLGPASSKARGGSLDRSAYLLLSRLQAQGPMTIRELHEAFGLDQSTLSRQTAAMLRDGVVERTPDPDGGPARRFAVTDLGAARLAADRADKLAALDKVFDDWDPEEVQTFAAMLRRVNEGIERVDGRPWPRP